MSTLPRVVLASILKAPFVRVLDVRLEWALIDLRVGLGVRSKVNRPFETYPRVLLSSAEVAGLYFSSETNCGSWRARSTSISALVVCSSVSSVACTEPLIVPSVVLSRLLLADMNLDSG